MESDLLDVAMATRFNGVASDAMWMTSMVGYAMLAIDLEDSDAAIVLLDILEPHAGEVATNLGPVAVYVGRLASLLGQHDRAERHLTAALDVVDAFGWDLYPRDDTDRARRMSPPSTRPPRRERIAVARRGRAHRQRPGTAQPPGRDRRHPG